MSRHGKLTLWFLLLVIVLTGAVLIPRAARQIDDPTPTASDTPRTVALYELVELSFDVPGLFENPYDPNEADVYAVFNPPQGSAMIVPAFFMRPYEQTCTAEDCTAEELEPAGPPEWRVRFVPSQVGQWTYRIEHLTGEDAVILDQGAFDVEPSDNPGYIRVGSNPRYFAFDNGSPYFPVGENLAWSWGDIGGIFAYERWLDQLSAAGVNYARLNIDVPWFIGLDWPGPAGDYDEAQAAAWRLDTILQMAEARGIYIQIILLWSQAYVTDVPVAPGASPRPNLEIDWDDNPYNTAHGGPLSGPSAIFFDANARDLLYQRLRYIVARWGYSPNIAAWEIVDEIDNMVGYTPVRAAPWLRGIVTYLRQIDPYRHLITAGARQPEIATWELAPLDFVQVQYYPSGPTADTADHISAALNTLSRAMAHTSGPVLLNEFSLNRWFDPVEDDPTGVHIRNITWAAALSGAAGGAMPWWWDSYIDQENLYNIFTPLALFSQGIPWNSPDLHPISVGLSAENAVVYEPLRINDFNRELLSTSPPDTIYRLTADGSVPPTSELSAYLYGEANIERSIPQTFIVSPPTDTELRIGIASVSSLAPAVLTIELDGIEAARVDFSAGSQNILVTIPISAGEHILVLDNLGQDWLQLDYIELAHYRAPVRVLAMADRKLGAAIAWIQHRDYTWQLVAEDGQLDPLDFGLRIPAMPPGVYRVTFWDTTTGSVIGEDNITLDEESGGILPINLLPITSQLAVRAFRIAGPETAATLPVTEVITRTPQVSMTPTPTETVTPTETRTPTITPTPTDTNTSTATLTPTDSPTPTDTNIPTDTPLPSDTPTDTPTITPTPSSTNTPTITRTPSTTRTPTQTPGPTNTRTPTATISPSATSSPEATGQIP